MKNMKKHLNGNKNMTDQATAIFSNQQYGMMMALSI